MTAGYCLSKSKRPYIDASPRLLDLSAMRRIRTGLAVTLACTYASAAPASANNSLQRCSTPLNYKSAMPELVPPETDSEPTGSADLALTISADGAVTEVTVIDWRISPDKPWIRDWFLSGVRNLTFDHSHTARRCSLRYRLSLSQN
jgi:hypothetical protein